MHTSEDGRDLIKHFEGLRPKAYRCLAGKWTIGWGHTKGVKKDMVLITLEDAEALLDEDIAECESSVRMATKGITLTQGQFDALVSFVFNLGGPALLSSTLIKKLKAGDVAGAADEFLRWCKVTLVVGGVKKKVEVPGLKKRRSAERELFLRQ